MHDNLAWAIIEKAIKDYKNGGEETRAECLDFFQSEWFEVLCSLAYIPSWWAVMAVSEI